jgi:hypothetical protein
MPYFYQDQLLSEILDYRPRAVFIDLLYRHRHEADTPEAKFDLQELAKTISQDFDKTKDAAIPKIPIIIPYPLRDDPDAQSCDPDSQTVASRESLFLHDSIIDEIRKSTVDASYIGWTGCGTRYPSFILGEKNYPTPAFALYEKSCRLPSGRAAPLGECDNYLKGEFEKFAEPMMIRWGSRESQFERNGSKYAAPRDMVNVRARDNWWNKATYSLKQLALSLRQAFSSSPERGRRERHSYTDTIHATKFLSVNPETRNYIKSMLENRIVLLGTDIDGVHDFVNSPVHGQLPGVYLFAMALDNYLHYGTNYFKEMNNKVTAALEIIVLFIITFGLGTFGKVTLENWGKKAQTAGVIYKPVRFILMIAVYRVAIPIGFCLLVGMAMWLMRRAPMDWISVSLLSFIANPIKLETCLKCSGCIPFAFWQKFITGGEHEG